MTFYEAALRILESEGRPLHFLEITEKSIAQNLLSHIGKTPEITMLSRLAAMARRTRDRKVVVTAKDTFALIDWALPEDAEALAQTGIPEPHPEEALPPLRPAERHPEPRPENARAAGRGERKRRRDEEEEGRGRRRRFPPVAEVAYEILSESTGPLGPEELTALAKERELAEELSNEQLLTALLEDNQRRIDAGRRPQFVLSRETGQLSLERAGGPDVPATPAAELQAVFAGVLGIPMENGRPVLARPGAAPGAEAAEGDALMLAAKNAVKDARRGLAKALRQKLASLDAGTFEKSAVRMMQAMGFRELKVAKRSKEGPLLTTRRREGSVELRFAVRMLKGSPSLDRKAVQDLRRDLGHYSAQVGLLVSAGDVRGDARSEAQSAGSLVMLWCGDALAEKFLEARTAVSVTQVELFEIDETFFETARLDAEEAQRRREERHRERAQREEGGGKERPAAEERRPPAREKQGEEEEAPREGAPSPEAGAAEGAPAEVGGLVAEWASPQLEPGAEGADEEEGEEGEDEEGEVASGAGPEGRPGQPGAQPGSGERKRRRRRRRGRRGRGARPEGAQAAGAPGAPGAPPAEGGQAAAAPPSGAPAPEAAPSEPAPPAPPPPPSAGPSGDGGTSA